MSSVTAGSAAAVVVPGEPAGGLNVLFRGVEVYEVRPKCALGWRAGVTCAALAALTSLTLVAAGLTALYLIWLLRRSGVTWRFDHKRKTITRRHWLRGLSRRWNARNVTGVAVGIARSPLGADVIQLSLLDAKGNVVTKLAQWDRRHVDLLQVQTVVGEIKKVMWWK